MIRRGHFSLIWMGRIHISLSRGSGGNVKAMAWRKSEAYEVG